MLFENIKRIGNHRVCCLGGQLIQNSARILLHIAVCDLEGKLFLELARLLRRTLNCDHLVTVWQDDRECGCDRENAYL